MKGHNACESEIREWFSNNGSDISTQNNQLKLECCKCRIQFLIDTSYFISLPSRKKTMNTFSGKFDRLPPPHEDFQASEVQRNHWNRFYKVPSDLSTW